MIVCLALKKKIMRQIPKFSMTGANVWAVLFTITLVLACNSSSPDDIPLDSKEGIRFSYNTIEQVTAQSRQENKPVFLLAHASYCSSCKKMKKSVFPEKEVGDLFNKGFINAQVDIESDEGQKIVKKYEITGTPTLLFLAPDGKVLSKASGFHSKDELIALTKGLSFNGKPVGK